MKKRLRKLTAVLLAVMLLFTAMPLAASAAEATQDSVGASSGTTGDCTWTLDDEGTLTISGNGAMEDYSEKYSNGTYITTAPWGTSITNVIIENGVTSIGKYAFFGCTALTSITIPDSVTSIGYSAFYGCTGLTSVTIPDSVTSIGNFSFCRCTGLTNIEVSTANSVYDSRDNCNAIIKTATNELVLGCKTTVIPDSVTNIGNYAFYGCTGLTSVTVPDSVTYIGNYAFNGCTGLTGVTIPNSVTSISDYTFYHCTGLIGVIIPNSVTSIGDFAFSGCTGLTSVTIPNSVTSIGDYAFYSCNNLTICGEKNSYAQQYAADHILLFRAIATESVGDADRDGKITISDVTAVQRYTAELEVFDEAALALADTNGDGIVNIDDATHLQRYLAEFDVVLGGKN